GLERRRVHRHQDVGGVGGGENVMIGEMQLEAGHARQGARRGPDLRREVRQRGKVVAERRRFLGEPVTGKLHAIARIASEPDNYTVKLLDVLRHSRGPPPRAAGGRRARPAWGRERWTGW